MDASRMEELPAKDVRITGGFWGERLEVNAPPRDLPPVGPARSERVHRQLSHRRG